jgi:hypothetical protein
MCKNILFVIIFIITGFVINYISCCKTSNTERYIEGMTLSEWQTAKADKPSMNVDGINGITYNHVADNEQFSVEKRMNLLPIDDCVNNPSTCFDTIDSKVISDVKYVNLTTSNSSAGNDPIMFLKTVLHTDNHIKQQVYEAFGYNFVRAINETNLVHDPNGSGASVTYKNVYDQNKPLLLTSSVIHPGDNTSQAATKISTKLADIIFYIMRMNHLKNSKLFDTTANKITFYRNRDFLNRIKLDKRWKELKVISNGSLDTKNDANWHLLQGTASKDAIQNQAKMVLVTTNIDLWEKEKVKLTNDLLALNNTDSANVTNYEQKMTTLLTKIEALNASIETQQTQYMNNIIGIATGNNSTANSELNILKNTNNNLLNTIQTFDTNNIYNSTGIPTNNNEYTTRENDLREYYGFDNTTGQPWTEFMSDKLAVSDSTDYIHNVETLNTKHTEIAELISTNSSISESGTTINNKSNNVIGVNTNILNHNDDIMIYTQT